MIARRGRLGLTHLLLVGGAFLWLYPFIWMLSAAFKAPAELFGGGLGLVPEAPTLDNFVRAWTVARFSDYFVNSVIVSSAVVGLVLIVTAMAGYVLGRYDFPFRRLAIVILAGSVFLPAGYTIIPVYDLVRSLGLLDSLAGVILAEAGASPVVFVLLFASYFRSVPRELAEAAALDGAGFVRTFAQVMLPQARPIIGTVVIMQLVWAWNSFLIPLAFTLSKPELRTLGVGMYAFRGENMIDWTGMAAAATISLLPVVLVFLAFQRYFVEGLAGSVKR